MKIILLPTLLMILSITLLAHKESSYEKGRSIYYENGCANCHGTNAEGSSYYPKLSNKRKAFLSKKLNNFKKGIATTQKQEIMFTFANALSKEDIRDIVEFLSSFKKDDSSKYNVEEDLLGVDF